MSHRCYAATRTLKVRLEADNPDYVLGPEMFVDVEFLITSPRLSPFRPMPSSIPVDARRFSSLMTMVFSSPALS